MPEQLKLTHKVVDVVDRANRKICVTLLWYRVDKPESSYAQDQLFAREKEDEKFQQIFHVNYIFEQFIYLLEVMNSVYDNVIANKPTIKPTIMLIGGDGTHCFARKTSRDYERETICIFEEIPPPITIKYNRTLVRKGKNYSIYDIIVPTPHWLIELNKNSFPISFYTFSVFSKAT